MSVSELPSGTVTFLFTDIEGSTRLIKQLRDRYANVLADHHRILRSAFAEHGGREIDTQGDSFFVAFRRAKDAVAAAVQAQRSLAEHLWPDDGEVRVRMGIHTGEPTVGEERYVGLGVHRGARICAAAHGGQVLVSQTSRELLRDDPLPEVSLRGLGEHELKDLDEPEQLYQLEAPGLIATFPPLRTADPPPFAGREGELAQGAADELARGWRRPGRVGIVVVGLAAAALAAGLAVVFTRGDASPTSGPVKENTIGVLDSNRGQLTAQIPVGSGPAGVAGGPDAVWVVNTDDQTVSQIDPVTNAIVQTHTVGAGPAGIATAKGAAWVTNALDGTVSRIDPKTKTVVWTKPVGSNPIAIANGSEGLWVVNRDDSTVVRLDPTSGKLMQTYAVDPGASAIAVGFGWLWVASERTGMVLRIHPKTGVVVQKIGVGNGPRAVAVGDDSVWVANYLDGTVSRIDGHTSQVKSTIPTGAGPSSVAVSPDTVWVADEGGSDLTRIDTATNLPVGTIPLGNPPQGVALEGDSVFVAVGSRGEAHRGGTLEVLSGRRGLNTIDPSLSYETYTFAIPSLTSDGLVAFRHVGGGDGSTLVPDLASALPRPTDRGKTYTFELRRGIHYSTGRPVRPGDFRRAIERTFKLRSGGLGYYSGIVGAARCEKAPRNCDLTEGIEVDNDARLVTFRLIAPDPDFLYKLMLPYAAPIPPGIPNRDVGTRPVPGTGPYRIARYVPNKELVFVRNTRFREWSRAARPAGYPDRIVWRLDVEAGAATEAVAAGRGDVAYDFVPAERLPGIMTTHPGQLHMDPIPGTYFYLFDSRYRPFNDIRVRRAVNYAVDRNAVAALAHGAEVALPTCQVLPPNFPGYRPHCPYTVNPGTRWIAPDLTLARQLIAASDTKGEHITVWAQEKAEGAYVATLLRRLGYVTRLKLVEPSKYFDAVFDPRNKVQIAALRWFADYPAASGFINANIFDCTYFCDRKIDRRIAKARALQATDTHAANALWADIDRDLTKQAPWLFLYNNKQADFVSRRTGNFQYNLQYGILLDQLWVK